MNSLVAHIMEGGLEGGEPQGYSLMEKVQDIPTETVTLSAATSLSNKNDLVYKFDNGYSITNNKSKGYGTGKENAIKYSANVDYVIQLPKDKEVVSVSFTGYDNYDVDSYIASLGETSFDAGQYVFPAKDASGNYTVVSHSIDLDTPAVGILKFTIGSKQTVLIINLMVRDTASGIEQQVTLPLQQYVDVFQMNGQPVRKAVYYKHALNGLPAGLYILGGQKVYWYGR
jgi:hypothetical protein